MAVGATRPWYAATARQRSLPEIDVAVTGAALSPLTGALALVALAGFGAILATRGRMRQVLGAVVATVALVAGGLAARPPGARALLERELSAHGWSGGPYDTTLLGWRWLVLAGAIGCMVAGVAVLRFGAGWSRLGPADDVSRSDGSAARRDLTEAEVWREIDSGRDPTQDR